MAERGLRVTDPKMREGTGRETVKPLDTATTLCCLAALGAAFTPGIRADESNRKTEVTFSGPVKLPCVHLVGFSVLPAPSPAAEQGPQTPVSTLPETASNRPLTGLAGLLTLGGAFVVRRFSRCLT